jgi:hypothetical protein
LGEGVLRVRGRERVLPLVLALAFVSLRKPMTESSRTEQILPVLPLRSAVLFPGVVVPFDVGRAKTVALA